MGKKARKAGKGKEKTVRKTAKAEEKRVRRVEKKTSQEDDIDAILLSIQKEEAKKKEVHVEENVPAPSPRSNCTLNANPLKETELVLYGGEFYNGRKTFVYGDLYRYDAEKNSWKSISSPNSPSPRSSHQMVSWRHFMYMFGGEFTSPNQERFHHYKDFWMFDMRANQWEQINVRGCPSPRSGHRMVLYKHKIIVFGGFYDTLREVKYFNDLHVFDIDQLKWVEVKQSIGCVWPSPRSGFQFFVYQDEIYLYGGYFKEISSDKGGSEKGIVHSDMWSLDPKTWEWNKVKKAGMPPGSRAGFSMSVHKRRSVLFGGVVDIEGEGDKIMGLFMNELHGFQLDTRRWYPLELRKEKTNKKPRRNSEDNNRQFDVETCIADVSMDVHGEEEEEQPMVVKPCGRINACMVVSRDTLYVYGGMMEMKDREITLDDLHALNLAKLDDWRCIIPASESEWIEISDDDDDDDDGDAGEESESGEGDSSDEEESEWGNGASVGDAVAVIRGEGKSPGRRKEMRYRISQIRAKLGLSDSQRTPMPAETLKDFYRRTSSYWQMAAHEHTQHTGKELRRDGFDLAEFRYTELKPVLDELAVLEAEQKAEEERIPLRCIVMQNKHT